jgi:hypothetical protein
LSAVRRIGDVELHLDGCLSRESNWMWLSMFVANEREFFVG